MLLWERWRPKKIEDIILLPRIRKQFESGVGQHYIFHGHYGTGKTSLARILIGKYSKETPFLELNCSMDTSIDVLREEIQNFCRFTPMFESSSDVKYVFLDEFERVSAQFQDAFKAFIEKYNSSVRFIITTNHINKISDGLKSRIKTICFDCADLEEEKYLKTEIYKKIKNEILPKEGGDISKESLIHIINKKFPDFRNILVELQDYLQTGEVGSGTGNVSSKTKLELYDDQAVGQAFHRLVHRKRKERRQALRMQLRNSGLREQAGDGDRSDNIGNDHNRKAEEDIELIGRQYV